MVLSVVILRHLLQPEFRLLMRLAVVVVVVVVVFVVTYLPLIQILLLHFYHQHLILNHCQQPEFH
jgi:hypothetical protein